MKPTPAGWPRLSSFVTCRDAGAAIDWYCRAFGFEVRLRIEGEGGRIEHSELTYGEALLSVMEEPRVDDPRAWRRRFRSPASAAGVCTQGLMLHVDDVDAHCAHARAHGAVIADEPTTHDYGDEYWVDRSYGAIDPDGHLWWFMQRLRDPLAA
jgi:uncharacterized glyoxalase superfamily protein PhnB